MLKKTYSLSQAASIELEDRVDTFSAPDLRDFFAELLEKGVKDFTVNLEKVSFLDSAGLAALVQLLKNAREKGGDVTLILPKDENVQRIFRLTKFDRVFKIAPSSV